MPFISLLGVSIHAQFWTMVLRRVGGQGIKEDWEMGLRQPPAQPVTCYLIRAKATSQNWLLRSNILAAFGRMALSFVGDQPVKDA